MTLLHFHLPDGGMLHIRLDAILGFEDRPSGGCALYLATGEKVMVEESYHDAEITITELARQARQAAIAGMIPAR